MIDSRRAGDAAAEIAVNGTTSGAARLNDDTASHPSNFTPLTLQEQVRAQQWNSSEAYEVIGRWVVTFDTSSL